MIYTLWLEGWEGRVLGSVHRISKGKKQEEVSRDRVEESSRIKIMEGIKWWRVRTLSGGQRTEHYLMILRTWLSGFYSGSDKMDSRKTMRVAVI